MKFDLSDFRVDTDAQKGGVWVDFGGDASFKIAALENEDFTAAFRARVEPYTNLGREIPPDEQTEIMIDCMVDHIVIDWKGIFENDEPIPFSKDQCKRVLTEFSWVRDRILEEARKLQNFRDFKNKATEGNSKSASGGKKSTAQD